MYKELVVNMFAGCMCVVVLFMAAPCMASGKNYDGRWTFTIIDDDQGCEKCGLEVYDPEFDTVISGTRICVQDEGQQKCFEGEYQGKVFTFTQTFREQGAQGSGQAVVTFTSSNSAEFTEKATVTYEGCTCTEHFSGPGTKQ